MNVARCDPPISTSNRHTRARAPRAIDDIVEREVFLRTARSPAGQDRALERHPLVDPEVGLDELCEDGLELLGLDLREEADLAEVDAEDRNVDLRDGASGAQEGAVASEDDEGVGRRQLRHEDVVVARLGCPVVDLAALAPAGCALAKLDRCIVGRVVGEPEPRHPATTARRRSSRSGRAVARSPARRCSRNSRFPFGPRDRRGGHVEDGEARAFGLPGPSDAGPRGGRPGRGRRPWGPAPGPPRTGASRAG